MKNLESLIIPELFSPIYINGEKTTYEVSSYGHVYNTNYRGTGKTKMMKEEINHGYKRVMLFIHGKKIHKRVHRLVAEAFIPNPNNLPVCHHKDSDKTNNNVTNLEWTTGEENSMYACLDGLYHYGENHPKSNCTEEQVHHICKLLEENKMSLPEIAKITGTTQNIVNGILRLGKWKHISKNYKIKKYSVRINSSKISHKTVIRICKLLENGVFKVGQISTICNVPHYIVSDIKNRKTYLNISCDYEF